MTDHGPLTIQNIAISVDLHIPQLLDVTLDNLANALFTGDDETFTVYLGIGEGFERRILLGRGRARVCGGRRRGPGGRAGGAPGGPGGGGARGGEGGQY